MRVSNIMLNCRGSLKGPERIAEALHVPGCLPDLRIHDKRRVKGNHILTLPHKHLVPLVLNALFEEYTQVPPVPGARETAVNVRAGEDETPPLQERYEFPQLVVLRTHCVISSVPLL